MTNPLKYFNNNVHGTEVLLKVMVAHDVNKIVFSSTAATYGEPKNIPILESDETNPTNAYGETKLCMEKMMKWTDFAHGMKYVSLRYFNVAGALEGGFIGEDPNVIPKNYMPYVSHVAVVKLKELSVFGDDYNTHDGTGVRDYIHVVDLANGHLKALDKLEGLPGLVTYNLGTGNGYSVLDMVNAFSKASGREVAYKIVDRRPGDVAMCYANPKKANKELGWEAKFGIEEMCQDAWRWQSNNPNGYRVEELELV